MRRYFGKKCSGKMNKVSTPTHLSWEGAVSLTLLVNLSPCSRAILCKMSYA